MARTRTRRRQQTLAVITAAALFGGTVAGLNLARHGHRSVTVAATGGPALGATVRQGDVAVVWQRVDPHSALGYANTVTAGGALYALSTAPGLTDPNATSSYPGRQLYRSVDGVDWTKAGGPSHAFVSDLSAIGDALYAVGTGPATVGVEGALAPVVVGSSADRGATWKQVQLPIDVAAIQAGTLAFHNQVVHVASSAQGVVVVAQMGGDLDVTKFLPAGVTAPNGWVITPNGVDLLGPLTGPACPAGMSTTPGGAKGLSTVAPSLPGGAGTTTRLGPVAPIDCWNTAIGSRPSPSGPDAVIDPETNHAVVRSLTWAQLGIRGDLQHAAQGEPFVFFSADGRTFHPVALPGLAARTNQVQLAPDGHAFVIAATTPAQKAGAGQEVLWRSVDGAAWTPLPAPPADMVSPNAVGFVAGRLTLVSGYVAQGPAVASLGSGGWSESSLTPVIAATPAGARVDALSATIGPFGVAVVVMSVIDPVSPTANLAASPAAVSLLVSRDGSTWAHQPLETLAGAPVVQVANMVVTANRFIVTVQFAPPNTTTAAAETVLVGTAR